MAASFYSADMVSNQDPPPSYSEACPELDDTKPPSYEGTLHRKHEWDSTGKKASDRSWETLYCKLENRSLAAYKNEKTAKNSPTKYFYDEEPINLGKASVEIATDYQKKPHVFRIKLVNGGEYLYQCKNEDELNIWLQLIKASVGKGST